MKTNLHEALGDMEGAVVTRADIEPGRAVLVLTREGRPGIRIEIEGCPYQDSRCETCSCDPDAFRLGFC